MKKDWKLTKEEQEILDFVESEKWSRAPKEHTEMLVQAAKEFMQKDRMNNKQKAD